MTDEFNSTHQEALKAAVLALGSREDDLIAPDEVFYVARDAVRSILKDNEPSNRVNYLTCSAIHLYMNYIEYDEVCHPFSDGGYRLFELIGSVVFDADAPEIHSGWVAE
jgi:hypothetical protein